MRELFKKIPHLLIIVYTDLKGWEANFWINIIFESNLCAVGSPCYSDCRKSILKFSIRRSYFWSKILFLIQSLIFDSKSYFWSKVLFLIQRIIFDPKDYFWSKVLFLIRRSYIQSKALVLIQSVIFDPESYFWSKSIIIIQRLSFLI